MKRKRKERIVSHQKIDREHKQTILSISELKHTKKKDENRFSGQKKQKGIKQEKYPRNKENKQINKKKKKKKKKTMFQLVIILTKRRTS